jgi:dTDP-4-amino-4,6-dideoxygalactose transaminase
MNDTEERGALIDFMKKSEITPVFHYLSLHKSTFYLDKHDGRELENSDRFTDNLVRLPLYFELSELDVIKICNTIRTFFNER